MSNDVSDRVKRVVRGVPAAIHCIAQHEEQVVKASGAVLAQAAQAPQHLPEHSILRTVQRMASSGQHEQLLTGDEGEASAVDVA